MTGIVGGAQNKTAPFGKNRIFKGCDVAPGVGVYTYAKIYYGKNPDAMLNSREEPEKETEAKCVQAKSALRHIRFIRRRVIDLQRAVSKSDESTGPKDSKNRKTGWRSKTEE
jgi:hypothetical protein